MYPSLAKIEVVRLKGYRPEAAGVLIQNNKVLLLYKAEYKLWQFPQGGIEQGENVLKALNRELCEELSIKLSDYVTNLDFLVEDKSEFPSSKHRKDALTISDGSKLTMKGKHYFFMATHVEGLVLDIDETEFDEMEWCNYERAIELTNDIPQKGKKRTTQATIEALKYHSFLNTDF